MALFCAISVSYAGESSFVVSYLIPFISGFLSFCLKYTCRSDTACCISEVDPCKATFYGQRWIVS